MSKHICAACRHQPATLYCSADAAFLCHQCDATIHAANKLAKRHQRQPITTVKSSYTDDASTAASASVSHPSSISPDNDADPAPMSDTFQNALASFADACIRREAQTLFASASGNHFPAANFPWISATALSVAQQPPSPAHTPASDRDGAQGAFHERLKRSQSVSDLEKAVWANMSSIGGSLKRSHSDGSFPQDEQKSDAEEPQRTEQQKRDDRQAALKRFRSKRANRSFQKKVRYECRKQLADSRPRVKGRFVGRGKVTDVAGSGPAVIINKN